MTKVIQIRGVSDDVHARLVDAAARAGKSLTAFLSDELEMVAGRANSVEHNRRVIDKLRAEIGIITVPDGEVVRVIQEGREARTRQLVERHLQRSE